MQKDGKDVEDDPMHSNKRGELDLSAMKRKRIWIEHTDKIMNEENLGSEDQCKHGKRTCVGNLSAKIMNVIKTMKTF